MKEKGYKDTLNLPRTKFSMKADLPRREPDTLKGWKDIYARITDKRKTSKKAFILHDGPPYANGNIHMGHVLNKILKDICVKYFTMKGCLSPYVPGWDCHGLPVEHQLFKELKVSKHDIDQVKFRKKAHDYAMKYVRIQSEEFKRLGIFGDWENPYLTLTGDYEADILEALADLYEKGYIYKDLKPVNWCSSCETALAEAEVEYEDKTSPSIYVKFKAETGENTYFVIWTTTPWTLLGNVAIALHPEFKYSFVAVDNETWIVASDLVAPIMKKLDITGYALRRELSGVDVAREIPNARHPFIDRPSRVVLADYVTREEGTGCVHTAPGHGQEDHATGKKYGLPVIMPVDNAGKFTSEAGEFEGRNVLEANSGIIEKMRVEGSLIRSEEITHSYPHCWRCKEPIIFRATEQWFMNIDHLELREKMIRAIEKDVEWIPAPGKERIGSMVKTRPDWCLSRQRYWGVPIPAFRCASCGKTFTNTEIIRKTAAIIRKDGANVWFERPVRELLGPSAVCSECGETEFHKEGDILDVWFDSGVSHKAVLDARKELAFPADLYLEGSDQHRGWFQAALITSMAMKGVAPYRRVLTHGFVVDGEGKKMSKSIGNVISPQEVMKKYGADILRLWVASSDYEGDIKLSTEILERLADGYRKIRNTFRFLLSNLYDFDPSRDMAEPGDLPERDRWMLSRLHALAEEVNACYENWEFHKVYRSVYSFCVYEISAFYLDVLKDVLYILTPYSRERRAAQTVIFKILHILVRMLAPILSFTAEEIWGNIEFGEKEPSVHLSDWPDPDTETRLWKDEGLDAKWQDLLAIRDGVMKALERKRGNALIGSSLEAAITLYSDNDKMLSFIRENVDLLPGLFKVSQVTVAEKALLDMEDVASFPLKIGIEKARGGKCQRCWNFSETVGKSKDHPELCERCYDILAERSRNG